MRFHPPLVTLRSATVLTALLTTLALALAGCSSDGSGSANDSGNAGASGSQGGHDEADVEFAGEMVPHHEQALRMVAMTRGRALSPSFERLTRRVAAAQAPEIRTMRGWLEDWGAQSDDGVTGHMHGDDESMGGDGMMGGSGSSGSSGNGMMGGSGGPGMMSNHDLHRLGAASTSTFEDMWLRMMIRHHQGAIAMARGEVAHGQYPAAIALAHHIEDSQQAEIHQMRQMLAH